MKIILHTVLFFLFFIPLSNAQFGFISSHTYDHVRAFGISVLEVDGIIYSSGLSRQDYESNKGMYIAKHDKNGNIISSQHLMEPNGDYINRGFGLMKKEDKLILLGRVSKNIRFMVYYYQYDILNNSITLIDSLYPKNTNSSKGIKDLASLNNDIYGIGNSVDFSLSNDSILLAEFKDDRIEEHIVESEYSNSTIFNLFPYTDSTLLAVGSVPTGTDFRRLHLMEIDTMGNILYEYVDADIEKGPMRKSHLDNDNNLIVVGTKYKDEESDLSRCNVYKVDIEGNVLWEKVFGNHQWSPYDGSHSSVVQSQIDDSYLIAGDSWYHFQDSVIHLAHIGKLSSEGDSIWYKTYSIMEGIFARHYINDFQPTSDGGYVAVGELICGNTDSTGYWIDPWAPPEFPCWQSFLIKINENGEIIPDTSSSTIKHKLENSFFSEIDIYPNPTSDVIYIEQNDIDNINYTLINQEGKITKQFVGFKKNHVSIIPIADLPQGIYYLRMEKDGVSDNVTIVKQE